jgi:CRP/FNR family transcriptional regulator, anaerobic regulatory protein
LQSLVDQLADGKLSCHDCSLAELCLPRGLDPKEISQFESIVGQRAPLKRNENIYRDGDRFRSLYAIKSGAVKLIASTPDGEDQIIGFSMPGELFGFDGINKGHTCTAVALERTTICELPLDSVDEISRDVPSLHRELYRVMAREISADQSMLLLLARRAAEDRLITFLVNLSKRFSDRNFSKTQFNLPMSRHDIANYLGLAPETVSRLFGRLTDLGLIAVEGRHIDLIDLAELHKRVDSRSLERVP